MIEEPSTGAPCVSIVLPTYRRARLIEEALASVFAQSFEDWELLVVDDNGLGSLEQRRTEATLRASTSDRRVAYVAHEANRGGGAARNTGIRRARGEFVAFLDDDDRWSPDKLALQVACFRSCDPAVALVYGGYRSVREGRAPKIFEPCADDHAFTNLLRRNGIGTTSLVLCRRAALLAVEGFDERLRSRQDIDLYLRLAHRYPFAFVDEVLVDKVDHGQAMITRDDAAVLASFGRFYDKHRHHYQRDRVAHHAFLLRYAEKAQRAGDLRTVRTLLRRAWRLDPRAVRALGIGLLAYRPVVDAVRTLKRWRPGRHAEGAGGR